MPYIVQRVILKTGEFITERDLSDGGTLIDEDSPVVGDVLAITFADRIMMVEIIWGRWAWRENKDPNHVFRLRAKEL